MTNTPATDADAAEEAFREPKGNCKSCDRLQLVNQLGPDGRCVYCTAFGDSPKPAPARTPRPSRSK